MNNYRCLVCGYIHTGEAPPESCPICDAPASQFELLTKAPEGASKSASGSESKTINTDIEKVVILGSGIAALAAAETLRDLSQSLEITIVTNESMLPYYRLNLTKFLAEEVSEGDLGIHPQYWYDDNRIRIFKNRVITEINKETQVVTSLDKLELSYDRLIIALGAHPFIPPIKGISQPGIQTIRSVEEAVTLKQHLKKGSRLLVLGGGVLGLETAAALATTGSIVTVAEGAPWLMPRQLNQVASTYIEQSLKDIKVKVEYGFRSEEILKTDGGFEVLAQDGRRIEADQIILATGVRPNTYLARLAGLEVNRGLVVTDCMVTSDDHIYAAGDITEHYGVTYGLWNVAQFQGKIAAMNLLGVKTPFGGVPRSNALKVLDVDLFSIGEINAEDASYELMEKAEESSYLCFVLRDQMVVGGIAIGYGEAMYKLKTLVEEQKYLSAEIASDMDALIGLIQ